MKIKLALAKKDVVMAKAFSHNANFIPPAKARGNWLLKNPSIKETTLLFYLCIFAFIFETFYAIPNQILSQIPLAFEKRTRRAFAICVPFDYQMFLWQETKTRIRSSKKLQKIPFRK